MSNQQETKNCCLCLTPVIPSLPSSLPWHRQPWPFFPLFLPLLYNCCPTEELSCCPAERLKSVFCFCFVFFPLEGSKCLPITPCCSCLLLLPVALAATARGKSQRYWGKSKGRIQIRKQKQRRAQLAGKSSARAKEATGGNERYPEVMKKGQKEKQ